MNKYFLLILLLLITGFVNAQKKGSVLHVIKSETADNITVAGVSVLKVYKGVFQQDNTILSSDSAYLHQAANTIEAFGHVIITQGDTLHTFGDKLDYNGNTKIAILTNNVRLVDKDATLTTNYFVYNTATKYGTYTGGGKLVNKDNTLVSKNGYYFASSRDSYFRYDVVLNTSDALIKTDTLRYNSESRIAYFYGPTNIYGKKEKDTLYTENGTYNTQTEQAFFGKNNLWHQKTKSLKGDSLFYDRLIGYGKAIGHVTFTDNEQKIILKGGLGEHFKEGERTLMTVHPYMILITENKDTTKTDSLKKDTIAMKVEVTKKSPAKLKPGSDSPRRPLLLPPKNTMPVIDTALARANNAVKNFGNKGKPGLKTDSLAKKDTAHLKRDSIFLTADTIETQIITYRQLRDLKEQRRLAALALKDTSIHVAAVFDDNKPVTHLEAAPLRFKPDTGAFHRDYFKKHVVRDTSKQLIAKAPPKKPRIPKKPLFIGIDSVNISQDIILADTARIRILTAAHHAKLFKSDLQAKADSIFFSYGDSVARMYVHPIIWAQGSQLSADTVNLQLKHKQIDNLAMSPSGMIVNIENADSTHFNQVGGKKMRGFFKNGKLDKVFVFGNAETIYFDRDSLKHVTQMHRTISSKIRVTFRKNQPQDVMWYIKPDAHMTPIGKVKDDDKVLRNFIWKPKDRPKSKEDIIGSNNDKKVKKPLSNGNKKIVPKRYPEKDKKPIILNPKPVAKDSLKAKPDTLPHIKAKPDTSKTKQHEPAKQ